MMRSLVARNFCTPDKYEIVQISEPKLESPYDVLLKVHAAGINPRDVKQAKGMTKMAEKIELPFKIGGDVSGAIIKIGSAVSKFKAGDEVFGMLLEERKGSVSEFAVSHEGELELKPYGLTHTESASLPTVIFTAANALRRADELLQNQGGLKGKTVFVTAGLSGVGSMALQLAKMEYGVGKLITTVSTKKVPLVPELLGKNIVDEIVDYTKQQASKIVPIGSVDFIFDTVGDMVSLLPLAKKGGVILSIGTIPSGAVAKLEFQNLPAIMGLGLDGVNVYYKWKLLGKEVTYEWVIGRSEQWNSAKDRQVDRRGKGETFSGERSGFWGLERNKRGMRRGE